MLPKPGRLSYSNMVGRGESQVHALPSLPVTSIDRLPVGDGKVGPLTDRLWQDYFDLVRARTSDHPERRTLI